MRVKLPSQQAMAGGVPSIYSRSLALAALATGFSLISSAFSFYYVKVFLEYFHIQESWFQFAQVSPMGTISTGSVSIGT